MHLQLRLDDLLFFSQNFVFLCEEVGICRVLDRCAVINENDVSNLIKKTYKHYNVWFNSANFVVESIPIYPHRSAWSKNWRWLGKNRLHGLDMKTPWRHFCWMSPPEATATSTDSFVARAGTLLHIRRHLVLRSHDCIDTNCKKHTKRYKRWHNLRQWNDDNDVV